MIIETKFDLDNKVKLKQTGMYKNVIFNIELIQVEMKVSLHGPMKVVTYGLVSKNGSIYEREENLEKYEKF